MIRAAGRTAGWLGRQPRALTVGVVGAAGAAGMVRGFSQSSATGDMQEQAFGDRGAIQAVVRGQLGASLSPQDDTIGIGDRYYGQSITGPRSGSSSGAAMPVGGEIVFGQYNSRR